MKTVIKIEGMHCMHCAASVEKAALSVSGVKSAKVNLEEKTVTVEHEGNIDLVIKNIENTGYDVVK
ncbi:MAG: heavy metal-associated domain-containing protein [Bacillota bacterium]|nr:heavy metal-associated domain-containing protein [Bacillota bacterium]